MVPNGGDLAPERSLQTLEALYGKGKHLTCSWDRLYFDCVASVLLAPLLCSVTHGGAAKLNSYLPRLIMESRV